MNDPNQNITISNWAPADIDPFKYQARKKFREEGMEELADSVREHGILQPLLARPNPNNLKRIELIAGERRLRAGKMAGLEAVPVIVREISDLDAEEMMLTENLQREDLSPVEEADALCRMLELKHADGTALYTQESLAAKLGKKPWEIKQAIKVRSAPAAMLDAVEAHTVSVSVAAAVGRIPDKKAREAATQAILRPTTQAVPLNFEQTAQLIRSEFMARIPGAGFDPKDAKLVPVKLEDGCRVFGGSCEDCPFRSGNIADISGELQGGADGATNKKGGRTAGVDPQLCTKPTCLSAKQDAQWQITSMKHVKDGGRVLSDAAAKAEFRGHNESLRYDSAYQTFEQTPDSRFFPGKQTWDMPKWRKLLKASKPVITLARAPESRKIVELITGKEAAELVRAIWKEEAPKGQSAAEQREAEKIKQQRANELLGQKVDRQMWRLAFDAILAKVSARGLGVTEWELLFQIVLDNAGTDGMTVMGQWLDIKLPKGGHHGGRDYEDEILKHIKLKATTPQHWMAWTVLASISHSVKWAGAGSDDMELVMDALSIDAKKLKAEATEKVKAAKPAKVDKPEKPAKKKGGHDPDKIDVARQAEITAAADQVNKLPRAGEIVRKVDDYKCDKCSAELYVGPGEGAKACLLPKGEMKCAKHGGKWQTMKDFHAVNGLDPKTGKPIIKTRKPVKVSKNQHAGESAEDFKKREAKRIADYKAKKKAGKKK